MEKLKEYFAGSYTIRIILGSLFAAVVADGIITKYLLSKELAIEGNPFLGDWVHNDAFWWAAVAWFERTMSPQHAEERLRLTETY